MKIMIVGFCPLQRISRLEFPTVIPKKVLPFLNVDSNLLALRKKGQ
jgi:hypothetical protein